ncbi:hypothetical protein MHYP_G00329150 [Metynnis hypsauchen]
MGDAVDLVLGSSGVLSEDLNNPCRESELKVMYEKLRRGQWADFVWNLKKGSSDKTKQSEMKDIRKRAENIIREVLRKSQEDILNKMNELRTLVLPAEDESNTKTLQYYNLAVQHIQMAIHHRQGGLQSTAMGIPDDLRSLADDCCKVGCLMALHNPPILLDWDEHGQGPFPPIKTQNYMNIPATSTEHFEKESSGEQGTSIPPQKHDERTLALDFSPEKASTSHPKKRKLQMASPPKKEPKRQTIQASSDDTWSTSYKSSFSEEVPKKKRKKSSCGCDNRNDLAQQDL